MELNIEKIDNELKRINKKKGWLAEQMSVSNAMISYIYREKPIKYAEKISKIFNISGKDLIIE